METAIGKHFPRLLLVTILVIYSYDIYGPQRRERMFAALAEAVLVRYLLSVKSFGCFLQTMTFHRFIHSPRDFALTNRVASLQARLAHAAN